MHSRSEAFPMSATQIVDGVDVPVAGIWSVDPGHTEVGFVGRHLGLTKTRGRFTGVDGTLHVAADPTASTIEVTIDMASVESGSTNRDNSLRSANYFDVDNHPTARFRSTAITMGGTGGTVTGDLTIKGVTRRVVLDVEYLGYARDPGATTAPRSARPPRSTVRTGASPTTWRSTAVACSCPSASSSRSNSS